MKDHVIAEHHDPIVFKFWREIPRFLDPREKDVVSLPPVQAATIHLDSAKLAQQQGQFLFLPLMIGLPEID